MILSAVLRGEYLPMDWQPIEVTPDLVILVAKDALKLGDAQEWIRVNVSHLLAQQIADVLGGLLPTTRISDLIHMKAAKVLKPCIQKPDAQMAYTSRMFRHSDLVSDQVKDERGLVSTVGKDWVLTNALIGKGNKAANYGWHDLQATSVSPGGMKLWQPLGLAHDYLHVDYSQTLRLISRTAYFEGKARDLLSLLQDLEVSKHLSYEGPLRVGRHPGIALYQPVEPVLVAQEIGISLKKRCLDWCLTQVGVKTADPKVRHWLQICVRGYGDKRKPLGLTVGNWCMAFQSFALKECLRQGDEKPHDFRAAVVEAVQDASPGKDGKVPFSGRWKPIKQSRAEGWLPEPGDLAVWDRSTSGKPDTSWRRHVNRVIRITEDQKSFVAVGGNEGGEVRISPYPLSHPLLMGWIHYPEEAAPAVKISAEEVDLIVTQVKQTLKSMVREFFLALGRLGC